MKWTVKTLKTYLEDKCKLALFCCISFFVFVFIYVFVFVLVFVQSGLYKPWKLILKKRVSWSYSSFHPLQMHISWLPNSTYLSTCLLCQQTNIDQRHSWIHIFALKLDLLMHQKFLFKFRIVLQALAGQRFGQKLSHFLPKQFSAAISTWSRVESAWTTHWRKLSSKSSIQNCCEFLGFIIDFEGVEEFGPESHVNCYKVSAIFPVMIMMMMIVLYCIQRLVILLNLL